MSVFIDDCAHPQTLLPRSSVLHTLMFPTSMTTDVDMALNLFVH